MPSTPDTVGEGTRADPEALARRARGTECRSGGEFLEKGQPAPSSSAKETYFKESGERCKLRSGVRAKPLPLLILVWL